MNHKKLLIAAYIFFAGVASAQQQSGQPTRIRVPEAIMAGRLTHRVVPEYPEAAKTQGTKGAVVVSFNVDAQGNVGAVLGATGDPLLREAAINAVKQWRFEPFLLNGEPAEVDTSATLQFPPVQVPKKMRVSQGVMDGNLIRKVNPKYPEEAKAAHIQGDVILQVSISPQGHVTMVRAISGHPLLLETSMNAVAQWKYKPFELNGEPVEVETTVRIQFHM